MIQNRINNALALPKWFTNKAMMVYGALLVLLSAMYMSYAMEWYFAVLGIVEIVLFFYYGNVLSTQWGRIVSPRKYEKNLFRVGFLIRLVYVLFSYWFYTEVAGDVLGYNAADAIFYDEMAKVFASVFSDGNFDVYNIYRDYSGSEDIGDMGYATYLGIIYLLTGNSILVARIIKAIISAYTAVLMYRISTRNFGEPMGRMVGIVCMLMPNFIYYCGMHLKETEMVFLAVLFLDQADIMLRSGKFVGKQIAIVVLCGLLLFTFRTVLAAVAFLAVFTAMVLSSTRIVSWGKRLVLGVITIAFVAMALGGRIESEIRKYTDTDHLSQQQTSMRWRTKGNSYAKYASASVFAPLIFTIPFPTMVATPGQENQRMVHAGNYIKNVTSGFTILALVMLLLSGNWRRYVLPLAYVLGYLLVLVMSSFAHSERFHMPSLPIELMFACVGIGYAMQNRKYQRWYLIWLGFVFVANIGWAYIKLNGRGL